VNRSCGGLELSIITVSRQAGSLGDEIAEVLSKKLNSELLTRDDIMSKFFTEIATTNDMHMLHESAKYYLNQSRENISYLEYMKLRLSAYVRDHSVILVGFGSQLIFSDSADALHVRIIAPKEIRISRIMKQYHVGGTEALEIASHSDRKQRKFVSTVFGTDLTDETLYDLILNTENLSVYECVTVILALYNERINEKRYETQPDHTGIISNPVFVPALKNTSEMEFAKILDMYHIDWKYEPKTFPIEWDAEGNVSLAFSPDFYLTKFDTYIELTTMNQKYITKKNNKMKKLKELYQGINIKIVNKKDFNTLLERFRPNRGDSDGLA
jgi:cytidylate kinase